MQEFFEFPARIVEEGRILCWLGRKWELLWEHARGLTGGRWRALWRGLEESGARGAPTIRWFV